MCYFHRCFLLVQVDCGDKKEVIRVKDEKPDREHANVKRRNE